MYDKLGQSDSTKEHFSTNKHFSTQTQGETMNQWMNQRTNQGVAGNETRNGPMDE